MSDQRRAAHDASSIDQGGRRGRPTAGTRPSNTVAVLRLRSAEPAPGPGEGRRPDDRVHRETTLFGALQLVDEGLAAAENSYRRGVDPVGGAVGGGDPQGAPRPPPRPPAEGGPGGGGAAGV